MRREAWSGTLAVAFAVTVGVAAQQSPPASQNPTEPTSQPTTAQPPTTSPAQSSEGRRITVVGCLQAAPASPVGTSGNAAPAPAAEAGAAANAEAASGEAKLVLVEAVPSPAETTAGASSSATPRTYRLIANATALNPHLGKKLELSGTVDDSSANGPTLRVEAGKVINGACAKEG